MKTFSDTISIGDLFHNTKFTIPEIQRDYAWDAKKEVSKLLEDMWKYSKVGVIPQYFIGTIIVYSKSKQDEFKQIMDGQQRITSIISLMAAIKSHIEAEANNSDKKRKAELEDIAEEIEDRYLFDIISKRVVPKLKPKSAETEETIKQMIQMDGKSPQSAFANHSSSVTKGKLFLALKWFYKRLHELACQTNPNDPVSEIIDFYNTITERIVVTLTTTTTIGMAFQMFVSVNSAGKPLNAFDILRGLIVAKSHALGIETEVGKEVGLLSTDMKLIEMKGDGKVSTCMTYWTEARHGRNIPTNDVANVLDEEIREFTEYAEFEKMIKELRSFSFQYHYLCTENLLALPGFMQHRRVMGFSDKTASAWSSQHMMIYAIMMNGTKNIQEINAVMSAVEWINIRGGWAQISNNLEKIYPVYARKALYEDNVNDWFDDFISSLTEVLDKAELTGFSHLESEGVSEAKATVLLHKVRGSNKDPGPLRRTNNCNGCRCMPEGAPSPWKCKSEKDDHGSISGLLGNWFLLRNITDKAIKKFEIVPSLRIEQMLKNANTGIEVSTLEQIKRKVSKDESWNISDIRKRNKELVTKVKKEWPKVFARPKL